MQRFLHQIAVFPKSFRLHTTVATQDDYKFYAYNRTDLTGGAKALVVLNFQPTPQRVEVDLTNSGIHTGQEPIDLLRSELAPRINGQHYSVNLPPYGFTALDVD